MFSGFAYSHSCRSLPCQVNESWNAKAPYFQSNSLQSTQCCQHIRHIQHGEHSSTMFQIMCARLLSHMEPFSWAPATEYTNVLELDAFKCTWTFASMNSIYELCEASSVILPTWVPHSWHNSLHDSFGSVIVAHAWWKLLAELSLSLPASSLSKRWIWHCIHWSNLSRGRTATWRSLAAERIEVRKSRNCFFD